MSLFLADLRRGSRFPESGCRNSLFLPGFSGAWPPWRSPAPCGSLPIPTRCDVAQAVLRAGGWGGGVHALEDVYSLDTVVEQGFFPALARIEQSARKLPTTWCDVSTSAGSTPQQACQPAMPPPRRGSIGRYRCWPLAADVGMLGRASPRLGVHAEEPRGEPAGRPDRCPACRLPEGSVSVAEVLTQITSSGFFPARARSRRDEAGDFGPGGPSRVGMGPRRTRGNAKGSLCEQISDIGSLAWSAPPVAGSWSTGCVALRSRISCSEQHSSGGQGGHGPVFGWGLLALPLSCSSRKAVADPKTA